MFVGQLRELSGAGLKWPNCKISQVVPYERPKVPLLTLSLLLLTFQPSRPLLPRPRPPTPTPPTSGDRGQVPRPGRETDQDTNAEDFAHILFKFDRRLDRMPLEESQFYGYNQAPMYPLLSHPNEYSKLMFLDLKIGTFKLRKYASLVTSATLSFLSGFMARTWLKSVRTQVQYRFVYQRVYQAH